MDPDKSLLRVEGIGPAREAHLRALGIEDLDQLAATSAEAVANLSNEPLPFSLDQVHGWIEEARRLAAPDDGSGFRATHSLAEAKSLATTTRESFVLTVAHDGAGSITDSTVTHVRSQTEKRWRGWSASRLETFVAEQAGLNLRDINDGKDVAPVVSPQEAHTATSHSDLVIGGGTDTFEYVVDSHLGPDVTASDLVAYSATVTVREVGSEERRQISHTEGRHPISTQLIVPVGHLGLARGVYELEMMLRTSPEAATSGDICLRRVGTHV